MAPFEKPVSLEAYPDYMQYVQHPMDLQTIERKVNSDSYETPEDFEYDCTLVFKNCEAYNAARKGEHLVAMAKYGAKQFRRIFPLRMKSFEDPSSTVEEQGDTAGGNKVKAEPGAGIVKMRAVPRISITAAQVSSAQAQAAKTTKLTTIPSLKIRAAPAKANQPVPLHIAIARVKVSNWCELCVENR